MKKIAILGTVGIPAAYGGFETLVENLVIYAEDNLIDVEITVFCSGKSDSSPQKFNGANLHYINLDANGASSIAYDTFSLIKSIYYRFDEVLLLGVSGAIFLPFVRLFSNVRIVTNIDGIEWKREKWGAAASLFLRFSEWCAVKFSHDVIADNQGIADHISCLYGQNCHVIAYGGDHATSKPVISKSSLDLALPEKYCLALCRIEPENNVEMILEAFSEASDVNLVFVGNWDKSLFGRSMRGKYENLLNITLLDPIYDIESLMFIRSGCSYYLHGHSAGGTNPSLVEMMHFGCPVLAYDCVYNRATTKNKAIFFDSVSSIVSLLNEDINEVNDVGKQMLYVAKQNYTWDIIGAQYFNLLLS